MTYTTSQPFYSRSFSEGVRINGTTASQSKNANLHARMKLSTMPTNAGSVRVRVSFYSISIYGKATNGAPHPPCTMKIVYSSSPQSSISTSADVVPWGELPTASIFPTTSMPSVTLPKTTCLPSKKSVFTVQMKNCEKGGGNVASKQKCQAQRYLEGLANSLRRFLYIVLFGYRLFWSRKRMSSTRTA